MSIEATQFQDYHILKTAIEATFTIEAALSIVDDKKEIASLLEIRHTLEDKLNNMLEVDTQNFIVHNGDL